MNDHAASGRDHSIMNRLPQILLIGTFLPLCWLGMMAFHELGHVLGAWATGATVQRVVLHPLTISRTDVWPNPAPLTVVWAGPLVGVVLPLVLFLAAKAGRRWWVYLAQFFAGFTLVANGGYIGAGSLAGARNASDPGVMLAHGGPPWLLWLFALTTIPAGLYLWNGLGPRFGLGPAQGQVDRRAAYASCALVAAAAILSAVLSPR